MKKFLTVILCIVMAFSLFAFVGCDEGSDADNDDEKSSASDDEKKEAVLTGTWNADVDLSDMFTESFAEGLGEEGATMAEYFTFEDVVIAVELVLNEDGTYEFSADKDSIKDALEGIKDPLKKGMEKYFEDMLASMDMDMTVDEFLVASGVDMDSLIDELYNDESVDSVAEEMQEEGFYKGEDGKLFMSDTEGEFDEESYAEFKLSSDELKITSAEDDDSFAGLDSITFKKK